MSGTAEEEAAEMLATIAQAALDMVKVSAQLEGESLTVDELEQIEWGVWAGVTATLEHLQAKGLLGRREP